MNRAEELKQRLEKYGPTPEVLQVVLSFLLTHVSKTKREPQFTQIWDVGGGT